jgi:hypothetical protein
MLSSQEDQEERRRVMLDEARARDRLREQGSTFLEHTHSEMGGRFSAVGAASVVGSKEFVSYPAAAPHQRDPCGIEPPLGYRIDEMEPLEQPSTVLPHSPVEQLGDPADASSSSAPLVIERAGSPPLMLKRRKL